MNPGVYSPIPSSFPKIARMSGEMRMRAREIRKERMELARPEIAAWLRHRIGRSVLHDREHEWHVKEEAEARRRRGRGRPTRRRAPATPRSGCSGKARRKRRSKRLSRLPSSPHAQYVVTVSAVSACPAT